MFSGAIMPTLIRAIALGFAALAGLHSSLAMASDDKEVSPPNIEKAAPARPNPLGLKPLDAKALATKRGGAEVVNDMLLKGTVADVRASNLTTGNNVIADGAFTGTVGLPMVIQNSGNGVLIQNATIVNVQVK
jgi:hypothetical protein